MSAELKVRRDGDTGPRWMTIAEVAEHLSVEQQTVRKYISRGVLPASRLRGSRAIRIAREDVEAMLVPIRAA